MDCKHCQHWGLYAGKGGFRPCFADAPWWATHAALHTEKAHKDDFVVVNWTREYDGKDCPMFKAIEGVVITKP